MVRTLLFFSLALLCSCQRKREQIPNVIKRIDSLIRVGEHGKAAAAIQPLMATAANDSVKAELLSRYGLCKDVLNQSDSGVIYLNLANDIWKSRLDTVHMGLLFTQLGVLYVFQGNYAEGKRNLMEALPLSHNMHDSIGIFNALTLANINQAYYDSANSIIEKYLLPYQQQMAPTESYYIFFGEGLYFSSVKKYDSALYYLRSAVERSPTIHYKANTLTNIADVYKRKRDFATSFLYLDSAKQLYQDDNSWNDNKQFDFDTYRELYDSLGRYDSAYHYAQLYRNLTEFMYNEENAEAKISATAYTQTIAERAKTEKANAESRLSRTILTFSVIALSLVALLAFAAFRNTRIKQKANLILTQQKQQVQQLADQLAIANDTKARLFSTIGHDLRSPVSSLYASLKMQELKGNATGGDMSEQTVRLLDTLEELLIWSKSQMDGFKVQTVKLNVRYFFEDLKEFYTNAAEAKNICLVNDTTKDVVIRADENLLKTIFRNAISNAITNTEKGNTIQLTATQDINGKTCMAIINPCCKESFQKFKNNFDDAAVKSGAYGLGIVLMKEFAQKLGGSIELAYTANSASLRLCI